MKCLQFTSPSREGFPAACQSQPQSAQILVLWGPSSGSTLLEPCCNSWAKQELVCVLLWAKSFRAGTAEHSLRWWSICLLCLLLDLQWSPGWGTIFWAAFPSSWNRWRKKAKYVYIPLCWQLSRFSGAKSSFHFLFSFLLSPKSWRNPKVSLLFSLLFRAVPWALQNFRAGCRQTNKPIPLCCRMSVIFDWDTCLFLLFWWVAALFLLGPLICFFVCCAERQMPIYSQDKFLVCCLEMQYPR